MQKPGIPDNEQDRIEALHALGILDTAAEERFDRLTRLAASYFNVKFCLISLVDSDRQWFKSKFAYQVCETQRDISFCGHAILQTEIMVVNDAREDQRFHDNPLVTGEPNIVFYAGAPLQTPEGFTVGTLCLFDNKPRSLDNQQLIALRDFADLVECELNDLSQKQLQQERQQALIRTELMLAGFPDMVFIIDKDHRYIISNDHPDLYLPKSQFIGQKISEVLPESIATLFSRSVDQAFKTDTLINFRYQLAQDEIPNFFEARAKRISDKEVMVLVRNVTDEQAQIIQLERLSMVAEQTTNGVVITDADKKVIWTNNAFTKITGYTLDEMLGKNPGKLLQGPETNPETVQIMRDALKHKQSFSADVINHHKDGLPYWVRIICTPWLNDSGVIKGFIAIQSNIDKEKRHLEEIKQSQKIISSVIDGNEIGTWYVNFQTESLVINSYWASLIGYSVEELSPLSMATWRHLTHPDDLQKCLKLLDEHDKGTLNYYESPIRMKHKAGHWVWIRTRGSIISRTDDGRAEFLIGTHLDINAQMHAEADLQEQYDYMQLIFDNMIDGIVIIDSQDRIQSFNPASEAIFGYTSQEILNKNIRMLIQSISKKHLSGQLQYCDGKRQNGEIFPMEIGMVRSTYKQQTIFVGMFRDVTERKTAEAAIHKLAYFDGLSGLPNRRLMFDRLQHALLKSQRYKKHVAILFIDFDNFKQINDSAGHDIGDLLLQQIAKRLEASVRDSDTVARLGGDEFIVILEDLDKISDIASIQAEAAAQKIQNYLGKSYPLDGVAYMGSCSIGITLCSDPSISSAEFLKQADLAMYQAKMAGKNAIRFFAAEMQEQVNNRTKIEQDLRNALEKKEFTVFYQTQVNENGVCIGAEGLLRWHHPDRGMVSPMEFIPVAEDSGLMLPIGRWILKQACICLARWAENPLMSELILAVNISVVELIQDDWVEVVIATITETGASADKLKLEVTESVMASDIGKVIAKLSALRKAGVRISLDDFGTGYSSLTYLKRLPLDQLKIDQSFVRDILVNKSDKAIAQTIINLAATMAISVIAEGVETQEQLALLKQIGCKYFQGYLFGRPVPLHDFERTIMLTNQQIS